MTGRSPYQERIIRNYYQHRDQLALQKLGEQVSNLYLTEGKARQRCWTSIVSQLRALKVPEKRIELLEKNKDPAEVAKLLTELMNHG